MPKLVVSLELERARQVVQGALSAGRENNLNPLTVVVLDAGGHLVAMEREDGSGVLRFDVARGKAYAALGIGLDSEAIGKANAERIAFLAAVAAAAGGRFVPVAGGVLILGADGEAVGAVGVSGDTSDADAACANAGIAAAGLQSSAG